MVLLKITFYQKMKSPCAVLSNILKNMSIINVILTIYVVNWFNKHDALFNSISGHLWDNHNHYFY